MHKFWEQCLSRISPARIHGLLEELVAIYSPSGKEEDIQLFLEAKLLAAGLAVHRDTLDETRFNLRCFLQQTEPDFYLVGHVDTVADWELQELGPRTQRGILYGLGSADMKAGCAAMVEAFTVLAEVLPEKERPPAGLLLVVGEEEDGAGSLEFLRRHRPRWTVIGEPTSLTACCAHYGYLEATLTTRGRRSHSSLPEHGHNAVESMLRTLLFLGRAPLLRRPETGLVYSIREMNSGRAGFVVPDRCETWIDMHLPPTMKPDHTVRALHRRLAAARRYIPDLDLEIDFPWADGGYDIGTDHWMAETLRHVAGQLDWKPVFGSFRSHSDGNLFFEKGCRAMLLGPGSLETAHTAEEQVVLSEVEKAARIYLALCLQASQALSPNIPDHGKIGF
ncbi:MAG: M20/M25/M40 family metallo-hydrolase [Syntrophotaleaceae bacterium]